MPQVLEQGKLYLNDSEEASKVARHVLVHAFTADDKLQQKQPLMPDITVSDRFDRRSIGCCSPCSESKCRQTAQQTNQRQLDIQEKALVASSRVLRKA
jgi:hypothetical protein